MCIKPTNDSFRMTTYNRGCLYGHEPLNLGAPISAYKATHPEFLSKKFRKIVRIEELGCAIDAYKATEAKTWRETRQVLP